MGKQNVKRSKALTQQVLEMIKEGYDAETIAKTLGYANASAIHNTARKYDTNELFGYAKRGARVVR